MLKPLIRKVLDSQERKLGESLDYVRHILRTSLRAFFKFAKVLPLSAYRRVLPVDAHAVAVLVATADADCGTCVQIGVNLAQQEGVPNDILEATVRQRPDDLPEALANVYRFTKGVVESSGEEDALRDAMRAQYGEEGLVELALAIASCRVFPEVKRALGFAKNCKLVEVRVA